MSRGVLVAGISRRSRAAGARPQGGGLEVAVWYLMRLTGVALFVLALAHFIILHFIFDPAEQTAELDRRRSAGTSSSGGRSTGRC